MSNPDVAGIAACKRLAKAGCAAGRLWRYSAVGVLYRTQGHNSDFHAGEVAAPTVGEMLAEIWRRGWYGRVDTDGDAYILSGNHVHTLAAVGVKDNPADALANTLAEALEKEKP